MSQYFPKPYERSDGNIKVEWDLSNYVTKDNLKDATGVDIANLIAKFDKASLKKEVNKIVIEKIKAIPVDYHSRVTQ